MASWKKVLRVLCLAVLAVSLASVTGNARVRKGDTEKTEKRPPKDPRPAKKPAKKKKPANRVGVDLGFNIPTGTWGDVSGVGIGGQFRFERVFNPNFAGTARIGYIHGLTKEFDTGFGATVETGLSVMPIMAGVKWQPQGFTSHKREGVYVGVEVGGVNTIPNEGDSNFYFGLTGGAGYEISNFDIRAQALVVFGESAGDDSGTLVGVLINLGYTFAEF